MRNFEKPIVVFSACLDLQPVRYNGEVVKDEFAIKLRNYCLVLPVCPEVGIGLGVPRDKIVVYIRNGGYGVAQPSTKMDLTQDILQFAKNFLNGISQVDGFLLKSKSPSCGLSNTTVYKDADGKEFYGKGKGVFALEILKNFSDLPVEDEGRLRNPQLKDHFLTRLFALAHWRVFSKSVNTITELMNFHRSYKYMLLSHSPALLKKIGRLLANYKGDKDLEFIKQEYGKLLKMTLSKRPHLGTHVNTFTHILGHFSDFLRPQETRHFLGLLKKYRKGELPITVPREVLRSWAHRLDDTYVLSQTYLEPYPEELA